MYRIATLIILALGVALPKAWGQQSISIGSADDENLGWTFDNGQEFPGATGKLSIDAGTKHNGQASLRLDGDFTKGGAYVQAMSQLPERDIRELSFWLKYPGGNNLTIRVGDSTGQCHQINLKIQQSDDWQQVIFPIEEFFAKRATPEALTIANKYESWGGAADSKWHGPGKYLVVIIGPSGDNKVRTLWLNDVRAIAVQQPGPTKTDFEASDKLPAGWTSQGNVSIDQQAAFKGKHSTMLERSPDDVEKPCSLTSADFTVSPGMWDFFVATKSDLKSPDSSFDGVVTVAFSDGAGKVLDTVTLVDTFGQKNWQPINKRVDVPAMATSARYHVQLNKASGKFWIDELSATFVASLAKKEHRIDRILFGTAQRGNLLFPQDKRTVDITVVALKPLDEQHRDLSYVVRDYWGAECSPAGTITLSAPKRDNKKYVYQGTIDLSAAHLEVGRYYELYGEVVEEDGDEPFRNYTSFAILPAPVTKQYKPEEIPFSSRNWDGRIPDFFYLADRIGVRLTNLWSGWSSTPPYKGEAPTIDVAEKLGMGIIAGSPTGAIENHREGWEKYNEAALREGARAWIEKFGKVRPLFFSLGNEPPVMEDRLADNVAGYKAVYEEVKKVDPSITVISTSIGASEPFFKAGFQNYCDVLDFHAYEDWKGIKATFDAYDRLFAKYGGKKPIWSTEIGLNSQGLARQTVARTMIKKITSFFACGGANVSWFDLGYPDADAKIFDESSSAHNVFDCRYARYCPKLDAISYYNMINGICIKKPAGEKVYESDIYAFLFRDRDNHCLQVIWKEKGRQDAMVPLAGVGKVTAIDIDGRRSELDAGGTGLTLTINEDPLLLLYDSADAPLADKLGAPDAQLTAMPDGIVKAAPTMLAVNLANSLSDQNVELVGPAFWTTTKAPVAKDAAGAQSVAFTISSPETTAVREANLAVRIKDDKGGYRGELRARIPVTGRVSIHLSPDPIIGDKPAGVRLKLENFAAEKQDVTWRLAITNQIPISGGQFSGPPEPATAYFADAAEGTKTLDGKATAEVVVPLAGVDVTSVYHVTASVTDSSGRTITTERNMAGFVSVPHTKSEIKLDGSMSEPDWQTAPVESLNQARQFFAFDKKKEWKGPKWLSADVRFLWNEKYLYVGVKVTDEVFANKKVDDALWGNDGLQFIFDPARGATVSKGKYDIAMGLTEKGPQAWCFLSADGGSPSGEAKDIIVSTKLLNPGRGDMNYVVAIPWSRLAPFKPGSGANLGLCLAINNDDGPGRDSHMNWFGDVESKQIDVNGDLILAP